MTNFTTHYLDRNAVEQAYQLLIEIARASLADIPVLPLNISNKALPILKELKSGLDANGHTQSNDYEWLNDVSQLFTEIVTISLSEKPRIPENLAQRSLRLADRLQEWQEKSTDTRREEKSEKEESKQEKSSAHVLLQQLQQQLKDEQKHGQGSDKAEWQQIFSLLDVVKGLLDRIVEKV